MWYTRIIYLNGGFGLVLTALQLPSLIVAFLLDEQRAFGAFLASLLLSGFLCGACFLGFAKSETAPRRAVGIVLPVTGFLSGAVITGLPFFFFGGSIEPIKAFAQGMALITTGGADFYFESVNLPTSLHIWRAISAWIGGFASMVMVLALYAQLNHGGVQLHRSAVLVGDGRPGVSRLKTLSVALFPLYLALTCALALALTMAGEPLQNALLYAASTLSSTGLRIGDTAPETGSATLLLTSIGLLVAMLNWDSLLSRLARPDQRLGRDPELVAVLTIVILVSSVVWVYSQNKGAGWMDALFLTVSGLSGTGWVPDTIRAFENPQPIIFLILGLIIMGGAAASASAGLKQIRLLVLLKLGSKELKKLAYPHLVTVLRLASQPIRVQDVEAVWLLASLTVFTVIGGMIGLSLLGWDFAGALYLSMTSVTLSSPFMLFLQPDFPGFYSFDAAEMGLVSLLGLIGRIEASVFLALFFRALWRG